jgi:hypothetical protein
MRRNQTVPSARKRVQDGTYRLHRPVGFADGDPALIPIQSPRRVTRAGAHPPGIGFTESALLATRGAVCDHVAAGLNPAAPASLVRTT